MTTVTSVAFDACICTEMGHDPNTNPYLRCWSFDHREYWINLYGDEQATIVQAEAR